MLRCSVNWLASCCLNVRLPLALAVFYRRVLSPCFSGENYGWFKLPGFTCKTLKVAVKLAEGQGLAMSNACYRSGEAEWLINAQGVLPW